MYHTKVADYAVKFYYVQVDYVMLVQRMERKACFTLFLKTFQENQLCTIIIEFLSYKEILKVICLGNSLGKFYDWRLFYVNNSFKNA